MNKQKGSVLVVVLSLTIIISLAVIGTIMFLSCNSSKNLVKVGSNQIQQPNVDDTVPPPITQNTTIPKPVATENNLLTGDNYYNCNFSGFFDNKGGVFNCQNGGGVKITIDNSKVISNFKIGLEITVPRDEEIHKTLDSQIPYAGAIKINFKDLNQNPKEGSAPDVNFIINVPLKSKLSPGTGLEPFLMGEIGWIRQSDLMTVKDSYAKAIVNQDGLTASFKPNPQNGPVGLFIVRIPDKFSVPTLNYDEINN